VSPGAETSFDVVLLGALTAQITDEKHDGECNQAFEDGIVEDHGSSME
jgi:hypothetical protein